MKKLILAVLIIMVFIFGSSVCAMNNSEKKEVEVPETMKAYTIIEYDDDLNMIIINEGEEVDPSINRGHDYVEPIDINKMSEQEREDYLAELKFIEEVYESMKGYPVIEVKLFAEPGLRVEYDFEGCPKKLIYREDRETQARYSPLPIGTTSPVGVYHWGTHNNTLTVNNSNNVIGVGRFTVFDDYIGEMDNVLKKGDCATRGDYDNPIHGQAIATRRLHDDLSDTNYTHTFYKRDNGALPDAILDIWKTGVEHLGLQYTPSLSFMGRYFYHFN